MPRLANDRYERFCHEYIVDGIGRKAAQRAGFPKSSAAKAANRLLARPEIKQRIEELQAEAIARANLSKDEVISGLRKAAALLDGDDSVKKGNAGAAVRALELLGKELSMFKDTLILESKNMSDADLVAKIAEANPQLADVIAKILAETSPSPAANVIPLNQHKRA